MNIKSIEAAKVDSLSPKVIVTGVTGQDGSFLAEQLLTNTNYIIYGAARRLSVSNHVNLDHIHNNRFILFNMDITDPHSIAKAVEILKPDYFINFAAQSFVKSSWDFPEQTWNTNCTAVLHMLEAIRSYQPRCRFYNAGSSEEFGDVLICPQDEKHPPRPRSPYGASKVAARQLVKVYRESYKLYAVQGWLFNHEGTRRGVEFVTRKITNGVARIHNAIKKNEPFEPIVLGDISTARDWGDAEDYVEAVWRMVNQEEYNRILNHNIKFHPESWDYLINNIKEYVVATGKNHSVKEFSNVALECAGIPFHWEGNGIDEKCIANETEAILISISEQFYRPAEVNQLIGNTYRIRNELGWAPTTNFPSLVRKMVLHDIELTA